MEKRRIAVIFGGCSSEHEVSRLSAKCVIDNIPKEKYEIILIGIDKAGRWFLTDSNTDDIASGAWEQNPRNRVAFLSPDRSVGGLVALDGGHACEIIKVDVVFPVLHGKNGEDGTIQGLFQMAGIPFVGCGTLASAVCMDKAVTRALLTGRASTRPTTSGSSHATTPESLAWGNQAQGRSAPRLSGSS